MRSEEMKGKFDSANPNKITTEEEDHREEANRDKRNDCVFGSCARLVIKRTF